jgi:PAS domain-containing protein
MNDVEAAPSIGEAERAAFASLKVRAYLGVPLLKDGRGVGVLGATSSTPRVWTALEIGLMQEVAERAWASVERTRAETALRESKQLLAATFDIMPIGVGVFDAQGVLILSNPEMRCYLPTGIMVSRDPARISRWMAKHRDGRRVEPAEFPGERAMRGESVLPGMEMLYRQDDGEEVWTRVASKPILDSEGRVTAAVAMVMDIDELKRTSEALRAMLSFTRDKTG